MIRIRTRSNPRRSSSLSFRVLRTLTFPLLLAGFTDTLAKAVEIEAILGEWERHGKEVVTAKINSFFANPHAATPADENRVVEALRRLDDTVPGMSLEDANEALCQCVEELVGAPVLRDRTVKLVQRGEDVLNQWFLNGELQRVHGVHDGHATNYARGVSSVTIHSSPRVWMLRFYLFRPTTHPLTGWELDPEIDRDGRIAFRLARAADGHSDNAQAEVDRETFLLRWLEVPGVRYHLRANLDVFDNINMPTIGVDVKVHKGVVRKVRAFQIIDAELNAPISPEELMVQVEGGTEGVDFRGEPLGFIAREPGPAIILADQRQEDRLRAGAEDRAAIPESGAYRYLILTLLLLVVAVSLILLKRPARKLPD